MLTRLLESKANHERSVSGAVASVAAHTALIGLAIYATAQARSAPAAPVQVVRFRPFHVAIPRPPASPHAPSGMVSNAVTHRMLFVNPAVSVTLAPIDIPLATVGSADFHGDPIGNSATFGAGSSAPNGAYATFRSDQVEKQVSLLSGSASPRYPESLRMAGMEGRVVAQFVVDVEGRVEAGTVRLVRSDNPLFDEAVRVALGRMRFAPAEIAGRKVRQLVEMPFVFALSR
jgi:periplasmic protein TonB